MAREMGEAERERGVPELRGRRAERGDRFGEEDWRGEEKGRTGPGRLSSPKYLQPDPPSIWVTKGAGCTAAVDSRGGRRRGSGGGPLVGRRKRPPLGGSAVLSTGEPPPEGGIGPCYRVALFEVNRGTRRR